MRPFKKLLGCFQRREFRGTSERSQSRIQSNSASLGKSFRNTPEILLILGMYLRVKMCLRLSDVFDVISLKRSAWPKGTQDVT